MKEAIDNFDKACNPFFDEKMKSIADFPTKIKLEYRPAYIDIAYDRNESCFFGITVDDVQDKGYIGYCRNDDFLKCGSSFKKMEMETFSVSHEFSIDLEYCLEDQIEIFDKDCNLKSTFCLENFTVWTRGDTRNMTDNDVNIVINELEKATMLIKEKVLNDMIEEEPNKKSI